jgi:hypothetical protein
MLIYKKIKEFIDKCIFNVCSYDVALLLLIEILVFATGWLAASYYLSNYYDLYPDWFPIDYFDSEYMSLDKM